MKNHTLDSSIRLSGATAFIFFCGLSISTTLAADAVLPQQSSDTDARQWKVLVSPYVWGASLNGDAALAGLTTKIDVPFSETIENLDFALMGNIEVTNGLYGVYFDGQYTETSQDENVLSRRVGVDITSTMLSGGAFYRIYETPLGGNTVFGEQRVFAIEPTVGLRWTKLEATVEVGNFKASRKAEWTDPFVGVRMAADITDQWNLFAEADIGGFGAGSDLSINAQAYLGYRTFIFDQPAILRVGYRVLDQDYETRNLTGNKFNWDVTQHGPVLGATLRF